MCDMNAYCGRCRKEFRRKNFFLQFNHPQMCVQFQFGYQRIYFLWRAFWAVYHVICIIISGLKADLWAGSDTNTNQYKKWFIYLTNWSYTILTLSNIVDATVVWYIVFAKRPDIRQGSADSMPWYLKTNWCLFNMANTLSVAVAFAYWIFIYKRGKPLNFVDIEFHLLNALYVIANVCVTGMPTRIFHFWFPVIVGIIYSFFTLFYHLAGGTNHHDNPYIYKILDWGEPITAFKYCALLSLLGITGVHLFMCFIHSLKVCLVEKCQRRRDYTEFDNSQLMHGVELRPSY